MEQVMKNLLNTQPNYRFHRIAFLMGVLFATSVALVALLLGKISY